jgi:hypothetical protein
MNPQVQRQVRRPNTFLRFGLPFIGFMVVGSLGLSVFVQGRKDQIDARAFVDDTRAPAEQLRRKKFDIGEEHEVCATYLFPSQLNILRSVSGVGGRDL